MSELSVTGVQNGWAIASSSVATPHALGDTEVLRKWLSVFDIKSPATARHYRTQTSKYRMFLQLLHPDWPTDSHLRLATEQDVTLYELALSRKVKPNGPPPPDLRLNDEEMRYYGLTKQPFVKALKKSSVNQSLTVLNALYEYLITPNEGMKQQYVTFNPLKRVRKSENRASNQVDRVIPLEGIQAMHYYVNIAIECAKEARDSKAVIGYERKLWMFTLLFGLWGRREELCQLSMGDFHQTHKTMWKVKLLRKGNFNTKIPAANWVIAGLRRYRASVGLPAAWADGDTTPAILGIRTQSGRAGLKHISAQTIYTEIKALADETATELEAGMMSALSPEVRKMLITRLKICSPHWFRHSGPTIAINSGAISIENASKFLGHSSVAVTSGMYYHADENQTQDGMNALGETLLSVA